MRILHTDFLRGWGGQPNRILMEAQECARLGAEILIAANPTSELAKRSRERGLLLDDTVSFRNGLRLSHFRDWARFRHLIMTYKPDILHLHGGKDSWLTSEIMWTIPRTQQPVIVRTKHNMFPIKPHAMNRWIYTQFFDYMVALSQHIHNDLTSIGIPPARIATIPDAYDTDKFNSTPLPADKRAAIRREFGFDDTHIVAVATGRFETEKGFDILITAAAHALQANVNLRFLLIGGGRLRPQLEAQALACVLPPKHFVFTGFRDDVADLLKCADIALMPSISEGLGTVALESGVCGLPIIASACGGLTDVVRHGETGYLVETANANALAEKLLKLAADPDAIRAMGTRAAEHIAANFSPAALGQRTMDFYNKLKRL